MNHGQSNTNAISLPGRWFYLLTVFFLALSGFGQMPIFKRYYIADIPGLAWLAEFFVTHYIHYLAAILFLAFTAYMIIDYLVVKAQIQAHDCNRICARSSACRYPGQRNLPGGQESWPDQIFHPAFIIFLDLCHLGLVMAFLFVSLYCLIYKKQWTTVR